LKVEFRKFDDSDIPVFTDWLKQPRISKWYSPVSEWIEEVQKRDSEYRWLNQMILAIDGRPIGFCQYYDCFDSIGFETWGKRNFKTPGETYSIDYLIGDVDYLGQGYGKQIVTQLTELVFSLGAKEIIVDPSCDNIESNAVLRSSGFTKSEMDDFYVMHEIKHFSENIIENGV
jgi:RimJ/RimL family protein N-acetyltransferase